ncbi:MAG TPA: hypothetical protein VGH99_20680 [Pseudonocardia sp.]
MWTLGGKDSDIRDPARYERVTHTFTLALASRLAGATPGPFTFCYLSGMGADQTESARLPWQRLTRHLKGRTEKDLLALAGGHPDFAVHCFRPSGILPREVNPAARLLLAPVAIRVDELAGALVGVAAGATPPAPAVIPRSRIRKLAATGRRRASR